MKDQTFPLILIAECAKRIEEYTRSGQKAFEQSPMIQDAVVWNLEIIGEATRRLAQPFRTAHPELPWPKMDGIQSLVQDYCAVDPKTVWRIAQEDLPLVSRQISAIMPQA